MLTPDEARFFFVDHLGDLEVEIRFVYDGKHYLVSVYFDEHHEPVWTEANHDRRWKPCISHCEQLYARLPRSAFQRSKKAAAVYAKRKRAGKPKPQRPVRDSLSGPPLAPGKLRVVSHA